MRIKVMAAMIAAAYLASCAAIDKTGVGGRVGPMNSGIADYRNEATLLNIVRASRHDPLNFVAISNVTGHNTLNLGVPVIAIPPMGGTTVTLGQGTDQYNASNDFNVNVVDDPASYVALHTPVDPATMAFFYQEGMPPDLLTILSYITSAFAVAALTRASIATRSAQKTAARPSRSSRRSRVLQSTG